jgi:ribose transport system permease protein
MVLNLLTVFGVDQPGKLIVQGLIIAVAAIIYQQGRHGS